MSQRTSLCMSHAVRRARRNSLKCARRMSCNVPASTLRGGSSTRSSPRSEKDSRRERRFFSVEHLWRTCVSAPCLRRHADASVASFGGSRSRAWACRATDRARKRHAMRQHAHSPTFGRIGFVHRARCSCFPGAHADHRQSYATSLNRLRDLRMQCAAVGPGEAAFSPPHHAFDNISEA